MRPTTQRVRLLYFLLMLLGSSPAGVLAGERTIGPGETLTLERDLILSGADCLEVGGTAEKPCTLDGRDHRIRTRDRWTGRLKIVHCRIRHLGSKDSYTADRQRLLADAEAVLLDVYTRGEVVFEHCVFDECNSVEIRSHEQSAVRFCHNTAAANTWNPIDKASHLSRGFFLASGASTVAKVFQGNRIDRGSASFHSPNWLIGGDRDEEGNLFIGMRTGIFASGAGTVVKGNYLHQLLPVSEEHPYWSQVATLSSKHLAEHNVIREGHWVCRGIEGEFRYNLVLEAHGHNHLQIGKARVHHNIFAHGSRRPNRLGSDGTIPAVSSVNQVYRTDGFELYNNTFDGDAISLSAIELAPDAFLPSLRNNVFFNFNTLRIVGPAFNEKTSVPGPPRLGYADYNLFYNPKARDCIHYAVSVKGKRERKDDGFVRNDVPREGKVNEQVDPRFTGPVPERFPFPDEEIRARKIGVGKILAFYRAAYTPADGSLLAQAGDPADGVNSFIGAVGAGENPPNDRFGRRGVGPLK